MIKFIRILTFPKKPFIANLCAPNPLVYYAHKQTIIVCSPRKQSGHAPVVLLQTAER